MKKLFYLLFLAIAFFGCSDDDSSESNQLFLEKWDGVVWEQDESDYLSRIWFNASPQSATSYFEKIGFSGECYTTLFGAINSGSLITIEEENEDSLILFEQYDDGEGNITTDAYTVTVINNGSILSIEYSDDIGYTETYNRTALSESEICN
jgi:hypothetical protein